MPNNLILIIAISNVQCIFNVHKKTIDFEHQEFSKLSMLEMWFKFREKDKILAALYPHFHARQLLFCF